MTSGNKGHAGLILGRKLLGQIVPDHRDLAAATATTACPAPWPAPAMPPGPSAGTSRSPRPTSRATTSTSARTTACPRPEALAAIKLAARTEGLLLDPVYTGKAMAGLIDHARAGLFGPDSAVVFIHTGGLPALFAFKDEILADLDAR